jgi:hypothetical protein
MAPMGSEVLELVGAAKTRNRSPLGKMRGECAECVEKKKVKRVRS